MFKSKNPWHLLVKDDLCQLLDESKRLIATVHVHFSDREATRILEKSKELMRLMLIVHARLEIEKQMRPHSKIYFLSAFHDEINELIQYIEKGPLEKEGRMNDKYYVNLAKQKYGLEASDWSKEKLVAEGKKIRKVR